jgi:hypothetical protein
MKRIYWILVFIFTTMFANSQDSWKIKLNSKVVLAATAEDEAKNTRKIKRTELNTKGSLEVLYKASKPNTEWIRSLMFYGETDNEVFRKDSVTGTTKIKLVTLKEMFGTEKKIRIYTISIPSDPNLAARVRVRRVHLCTLELQ